MCFGVRFWRLIGGLMVVGGEFVGVVLYIGIIGSINKVFGF